jgi:hypothetical protein
VAKDGAVTVSVHIPSSTRVELERRAEENYRSISAEIRMAITEHVRREPTPERERHS